ncbi:hypothetical protein HCN44_007503 [Aphidius gifuensis]|uniref:Uncharacterized protein n=1 Tax=Aphidius gifuensis TaxID=684658 RepID=A0A835CM49_APHGI|nr:uncharacterized protein LOC122859354 [Aphidius gifuensis]KAF7988009.1 hypothetical protein HCN44_007503 [Aphidius gifuensis]
MTPIIEEKILNDKYISIEEGQPINVVLKKDKNNYSRFIGSIKIVLFLQLIIAIVYVMPTLINFKNEKIEDVKLESMTVNDHIDEKLLENISNNLLNDNLMLDTIMPVEIDTLL